VIRETTENESAHEGYRFGQEEEIYDSYEFCIAKTSNLEIELLFWN
jgi:hypothetical protein